jgi:DNA helicase-2/ATP-dependent DNA helicase PcrA
VPAPLPKATRRAAPEAGDAELFGRLRAWRKRQAEALSVPAYVVFSDATLVGIADAHPGDRGALARVNGVGPAKLDRFGPAVLEVVGGADPDTVGLVE